MYDPTTDSSPSVASKDPTRVVIALATRKDPKPGAPEHVYLGDNGEHPTGEKAQFCIGHDAKLKGKLIRAHNHGVEVMLVIDGKPSKPQTALSLAKSHGWDDFLTSSKTKFDAKASEQAQRAEAREKAKTEREAAKQAKAQEREAAKVKRTEEQAKAKAERERVAAEKKAEREKAAEAKREEKARKEHEKAEAKAKKEQEAEAKKAASAAGTKNAAK